MPPPYDVPHTLPCRQPCVCLPLQHSPRSTPYPPPTTPHTLPALFISHAHTAPHAPAPTSPTAPLPPRPPPFLTFTAHHTGTLRTHARTTHHTAPMPWAVAPRDIPADILRLFIPNHRPHPTHYLDTAHRHCRTQQALDGDTLNDGHSLHHPTTARALPSVPGHRAFTLYHILQPVSTKTARAERPDGLPTGRVVK